MHQGQDSAPSHQNSYTEPQVTFQKGSFQARSHPCSTALCSKRRPSTQLCSAGTTVPSASLSAPGDFPTQPLPHSLPRFLKVPCLPERTFAASSGGGWSLGWARMPLSGNGDRLHGKVLPFLQVWRTPSGESSFSNSELACRLHSTSPASPPGSSQRRTRHGRTPHAVLTQRLSVAWKLLPGPDSLLGVGWEGHVACAEV